MPDFDPIGTVAFFRERHRAETITTANVLRAMKPDMMDYRLHLESSPLGAIAWTIVRCLRICSQLTRNATVEVPRDPAPSYKELPPAFDRAAEDLGASLLGVTQEQWQQQRIVRAGSHTLLDQPLGQIFWLFHADSIHHRGQISVFLRPFGAKVPSIYGPSGDVHP